MPRVGLEPTTYGLQISFAALTLSAGFHKPEGSGGLPGRVRAPASVRPANRVLGPSGKCPGHPAGTSDDRGTPFSQEAGGGLAHDINSLTDPINDASDTAQ